MTKVLIADACKPSLVMSSEIFKDKIPGTEVIVAATGAAAIELAQKENPDLCLVDFDLPDADGASLIVALRRVYHGPLLLQAFPDAVVSQAVSELLFGYNDASGWVRKPVQFDELSHKIDTFLLQGQRLGKRFDTDLETKVIAKAAGRGKRAPKATGRVINISLGGACIALESPMKMKKSQELTLSISFPAEAKAKKKPVKAVAKPSTKNPRSRAALKTKVPCVETKIKAKVCWVSKDQVGLQFGKLTDVQRNGLEGYLRRELTVDEVAS